MSSSPEQTQFLPDRQDADGNVGLQPSEGSSTTETSQVILIKYIHGLPVLTSVFIILSLFTSYGVAVDQGHVEPDFPYISHTAVETPERCIFAQLINMGALLMALNILVRYLQQRELFHGDNYTAKDRRLCLASLATGWISAFGLSMVANFQTIVMRPPHYVGAFLAFGFGMIYMWIQTAVSLRHRRHTSVRIVAAQLMISVIQTFFLVAFGISKAIFKIKASDEEVDKFGSLRGVYLLSTVSEWLTAVAVVVFPLTFCPDFSLITVQAPRALLSNTKPTSVPETAAVPRV